MALCDSMCHYLYTRGRESPMLNKFYMFLPAVLLFGGANAMDNVGTKSPKILVAYFSMQDGNTGDVARAIVDASGGDVYRIMVVEAYPDDDKARKERLMSEIQENKFPELQGPELNVSEYDIVFLGSPVWGNHLAQPVKSFLHKYDLSGKTVIPFVSHSGGGRGKAFTDVAGLCDGCIVDTDGWSSWGGGRQRGIDKWVNKKIGKK